MSIENQFCTFYIDGLCFGIKVRNVQEVLRFQNLTSVPLASAEIAGLINLRGQIVTAVDLRRRLQMGERSVDSTPINVVVNTSDGPLSLLVDEIGDVVEVDEDTFEPPPDTLTGLARQLLSGVYKMKDKLLLVVDMEKAVDVGDAGREAE